MAVLYLLVRVPLKVLGVQLLTLIVILTGLSRPKQLRQC